MRTMKYSVGILMLVLMVPQMVFGTEIIAPHPYIINSAQGYFSMKYLPDNSHPLPPTCILFTLLSKGRERTLWKRRLINTPQQITIEDTWLQPIVVTVGNAKFLPHSDNFDHFLVIYNSEGKIVSDFNLDDLLTPEEKASFPTKRDVVEWMYGVEYKIGQGEVSIHLKSGRFIKISGRTGKIE